VGYAACGLFEPPRSAQAQRFARAVGRFVNGGSGHAGQIEFGHREVDMALAGSVHAMPRLTHRSGYSRKIPISRPSKKSSRSS